MVLLCVNIKPKLLLRRLRESAGAKPLCRVESSISACMLGDHAIAMAACMAA